MASYRYQGRESGGAAVSGVIEAESRRSALELLARRGLFPSSLTALSSPAGRVAVPKADPPSAPAPLAEPLPGRAAGEAAAGGAALRATGALPSAVLPSGRVSRKEITAFTREMATLLGATIPIPAALEGLGQEEENPALKAVILELASSVRRGNSLSAALEAHPRLFSRLYISMIRVGEEAGALDRVMADLAELLEHEDETRGEVLGAVAYPCFVLALGVVTAFVLLAFVLPRLFGMLEEMVETLPLPTWILLQISSFSKEYWPWILVGVIAVSLALRWYLRSEAGGLIADRWKLRLWVVGPIFRSSALSRFARTLGTLVRSGVSLLPALEIVRNTIGNRLVAQSIARVAEETRGGDSLAAPLKKLSLFSPTTVQMIAVGEETGRLDEMLLRVAKIEERQMRGRSRTLISLLGPALIVTVGALVGFIVIALLLPIFRMSQAIR